MKPSDIRICLLRVGGTNCDAETKRSFEELGVKAEVVHVNEVVRRHSLLEYDALVFPGGFSYGDYVRAGAIWAKWIVARLGRDLAAFVEERRPVLGVCNGFQVLVEAGLLPGFEGMSAVPEAALANNISGYTCRWINLKHESNGKCAITSRIPKGKVLRMPVAHGEGRLIFPKEKEKQLLKRLIDGDQIVFRYCHSQGEYAESEYPANPNGSFYDIAGICSPDGTVFGLMPHPERSFYGWQQPDWTGQKQMQQYGDGKLVFESIVDHLRKK